MSVPGDALHASETSSSSAPTPREPPSSAAARAAGAELDVDSLAANAEPGEARAREVALGALAGFALLALTEALAIACAVPLPRGGAWLRAAHHAFDAAETLGLGALAALLFGLFLRFAALPVWALLVVYAVAATGILHAAIGSDLHRQASVALEGRLDAPIFGVLMGLCAAGFAAALGLAVLLSRRRRLRFLPIALAVAAMIGNHLALTDDYFGVHGVVAWAAATVSGGALGPLAARLAAWLMARRAGRAALVVGAVVAALGLLVPPSNRVRQELFRDPCSLAWVLAATVWRAPEPRSPALAANLTSSPWWADRSALPPSPPTRPGFLTRRPAVVFITVDALRADAVSDPANDALFPTLSALKRTGAFFTRATAPGSQTAVSLTTMFSGRYFSALSWDMHGAGSTRFLYAADDPSPRFPELLAQRGVRTAAYLSINFLVGDYGVTRGFQEEQLLAQGRQHAPARQVIDPLLDRLRRANSEPLFLYAHLTEPHAPYDRGQREGTDHQRYLSEVAVADAQIGRVAALLQQRFADRGVLIVSSDHGEAFGEHQTYQHTKTLYEELLRVPLLIRGPGIAARTIDERAGLIDLGPTILDLFRVESPSTYFGQSLLPVLLGRSSGLSRPLVAEGRLRRAMYVGEALKVIDDPRRKVVEVYDLARDPGETENLFESDPARADPALRALRAFFAAHARGPEGYRAAYKP